MLNGVNTKKLAAEIAPLALILIGVALVAFSIGPYQNYDTKLEFEAASNTVTLGVPYVKSFGTAIDQPPLGFYLEGLFFRVFGMSADVGVTLVSLFGLGSTVLMYLLGRELYGKSTGLFAAALFGLNPWQLVLSRSFLIDSQCLFLSLLCLLLGVYALRKGSLKFTLASGIVFAAALLTKFYAVFMLIPLLLLFVYSKPKLKHVPTQLAAFSIPALAFAFGWYQIIRGVSVLTIFQHNDLADVVPASTGVVTSPFFVTNFLRDYGLGLYFMVAVVFALILGFSQRKYFSKTVAVELTCLATITFVLGVNVVLGAGLNLNVPYFSAVKYDFQALPFLVLLAASLGTKGFSMVKQAKSRVQPKKMLLILAAAAPLALLAASLISSMYYTYGVSTHDYLQYRVEPQVDYGYALLNPTPLAAGSEFMVIEYLGFAAVLSGLLWAGRQKVLSAGRMLKGFISAGHRMLTTTSSAENMTDQPKPQHTTRFGAVFNKWRVAFLVFALAYLVVLLLNLVNMPMQWDEVVHLNGALTLNGGLFSRYVSNAFYPPLYDSATAVSFLTLGTSLFAARLVSALFSVLSLFAVFELAYSMYNGKTALLAAVFLGIMPGYFWLSRLALLETMLLFFVTLSLLFFYRWLQGRQDRYLVLAGLAVGLGFLTKYQAVVAGVIMIFSLLFLARGQLKHAFSRFSLAVVAAVLVVVPWIVIAYQVYASGIFSQWLYALQVGNPEKSVYSGRYPSPIFYFIEVVWPYSNFHPISIFLYVAGLAGLGLLLWRHSKNDQFVLIWFACVFVFFSLIVNKEWRYVLPLFPALAIAAAVLILFLFGKVDGAWRKRIGVDRNKTAKIAAGVFIVLIAGAIAYSVNDAYSITAQYDINIQLEPATQYAISNMQTNQTIIVLCPFNFFSQDMIKFYLTKNGANLIQTYQYPVLPTDTYTPNFNITELISECRQNNVKFVFTYEQGGTVPYYNTTLNPQQVFEQLYASGNFTHISDQATFGTNPRRIFILTFIG